MSQRVVAPLVRLTAWSRQSPDGKVYADLPGLRAGDPSAELFAALQQAIVERGTTPRDDCDAQRHADVSTDNASSGVV